MDTYIQLQTDLEVIVWVLRWDHLSDWFADELICRAIRYLKKIV